VNDKILGMVQYIKQITRRGKSTFDNSTQMVAIITFASCQVTRNQFGKRKGNSSATSGSSLPITFPASSCEKRDSF